MIMNKNEFAEVTGFIECRKAVDRDYRKGRVQQDEASKVWKYQGNKIQDNIHNEQGISLLKIIMDVLRKFGVVFISSIKFLQIKNMLCYNY